MYSLKKIRRLTQSLREQARSHNGSGYIHKIRSAIPLKWTQAQYDKDIPLGEGFHTQHHGIF